jgi:4-alpha-glucanotransferase
MSGVMFKRGSGVLLHITSLPSPAGIGDLGPYAYTFADRLHEASQKYWQVLPLNPGNPENGESPYFSSSAFAGNPMLISLEKLVDDGLLTRNDIVQQTRCTIGTVDYGGARLLKGKALDKAYHAWRKSGIDAAFVSFCEQQAFWLDDYALFCTIGKYQKSTAWYTWPYLLRSHDRSELLSLSQSKADEIEKICFFQYLLFKQWHELKMYCNSRGVMLVGDMPIYVSYESSDVWVHRDNFKLDLEGKPLRVSGVPPDYFSATGQLWNNPVYSWDNIRRSDYQWWLKRMQAMFALYDIVRIDHFRGLVQYWEINAGESTAINGTWQDVPTRELLDLLKKSTPTFPVIAEDLGVITSDVRQVMKEYGFPGMRILLFAFSEDNASHPYLPHNFEQNCVVYTGTHDNNTVRGWLETEATEIEKSRVYRYIGGKQSDEDTVWEFIRLAQMSIADMAIIPLQDLLSLGAHARMNLPSKIHGNWRWRMTTEQFDAIPFGLLHEFTKIYGRSM